MFIENQKQCPSCENTIDKQIKLKLLKKTSIPCPHCAKDLRVSESKASLITFPLYALFGLGLYKYTDLSHGAALAAIVIAVAAMYLPTRSIEILFTKLKLVQH